MTKKVITQQDVCNTSKKTNVRNPDADAVQDVVDTLNRTENAVVRIVASSEDIAVQSVFFRLNS